MENTMENMTIIDKKHIDGESYFIIRFEVDDEVLYGTLNTKYVDDGNRTNKTICLGELLAEAEKSEAIKRRTNQNRDRENIINKAREIYSSTDCEKEKIAIKKLIDELELE